MRFKGGPHENPARGVVTIFLPKSAHAHPNSNNPPGRRDLAAITIAGGASSRSRAAAATERFTIYRRVQGGKCAGPDVEAAGCIRSLVATAHKRRSKAAHWLPLPHDRGAMAHKAQSTKHRRPSPSCVRCWKAQVPKNQWFSTPRAAPRRHSKPAWPMNTKARWRVPLASSSADVGAAGTVCSLFWCR